MRYGISKARWLVAAVVLILPGMVASESSAALIQLSTQAAFNSLLDPGPHTMTFDAWAPSPGNYVSLGNPVSDGVTSLSNASGRYVTNNAWGITGIAFWGDGHGSTFVTFPGYIPPGGSSPANPTAVGFVFYDQGVGGGQTAANAAFKVTLSDSSTTQFLVTGLPITSPLAPYFFGVASDNPAVRIASVEVVQAYSPDGSYMEPAIGSITAGMFAMPEPPVAVSLIAVLASLAVWRLRKR